MNGLAIAFLALNSLLILVLPKRFVFVPLLLGACYMTRAHGFDVGPLSFPAIRVLILASVLRVTLRGELKLDAFNATDKAVLLWAAWGLLATALHPSPSAYTIVWRLGQIYDIALLYFVLRCLMNGVDSTRTLAKSIAIVLVPLALEMLSESLTGRNAFAVLGGVAPYVQFRDGTFRAQGPFAHSILAGTVGAACFPLVLSLWYKHRPIAVVGMLACTIIVVTSGSSGPISALLAGLFAVSLWRYRRSIRALQFCAVLGYIFLEMVMSRPAYYIITYANLTGSGTGWHRAYLIETSIKHLNEWWLAGTNYTRHWMPTGVSWSPDHADITNYYLVWGVAGGLAWLGAFVWILLTCFRNVGFLTNAHQSTEGDSSELFAHWCMGAALFAHAVSSISVAYFDQSFIFMVLVIAAISGARSTHVANEARVSGSNVTPRSPIALR